MRIGPLPPRVDHDDPRPGRRGLGHVVTQRPGEPGRAELDDGLGQGGRARTMASAAAMVPSMRQRDSGSASTGQPKLLTEGWTSAGSGGVGDGPPTMNRPRPLNGSPGGASRAGRPSSDRRRRRARRQLVRPLGQRLAEGEVEVHGPRTPRAVRSTRRTPAPPAVARCAPGRRPAPRVETATRRREKSPSCSIVCEAPVWWSSGGRSAVQTMRGTRAWWASTTAGCSSAAAVPLVTQTTTGRPGRLGEAEGVERGAALVEADVGP